MTAKIVYSIGTSLDGYIEDEQGVFDWVPFEDEVFRFINERERRVGTYLFGRRLYETMKGWDDRYGTDPALPPPAQDYANVWAAADKVVYSTTLTQVSTAKTRLERTFDVAAVREMKARAERDLSIGGAGLAAHAFRAGLVDEINLLVAPVILGGGKPALPDDVRLTLELVEARAFEASGFVHLRYRCPRERSARDG